jgi:hypothetical protein
MMKRFIRIAMLLCAAIVLLSALSLKTVEAKATASKGLQAGLSATTCQWSVVPSPSGGSLWGVAAVSESSVWAVGTIGSQLNTTQTVIEHWNGSSWSVVKSPNPGSIINSLYGVAAVSATNIWAVGYYVQTSGVTQTLIEHWNGTQWSVVKSPSPASVNNELFGVAAVSASNIWAVGFAASNSSAQTTLIEHWNGTQWSVVKSASPGSPPSDALTGVAAISASNVWAVGSDNTSSGVLIEHWNGTQWSVVKSASSVSGGDLRAVAAVSASDVWAVGYYSTSSGSIVTLAERWNGTSWQVVKSPNVGTHPTFSAVAAVSAQDVWAVGNHGSSTAVFQTLTEQWNGSQWSVVKSPSPGSFSSQLLAVAAISATNVWAVGAANGTLIEHFHC